MIIFPGDNKLGYPDRTTQGAHFPIGGAERYNYIDADLITVRNIDASTASIKDATIVNAKIANATIQGGKIAAETITGDNVAANTITANKMSVSQLSAIAANLGTITAGSITGVTVTIQDTVSTLNFKNSSGVQQGSIYGYSTWLYIDAVSEIVFTKTMVGATGASLITPEFLACGDGMTAPSATTGYAKIYVDSADGDLKVKFGDGVTKTLATDT